jgi:hypothetical protein
METMMTTICLRDEAEREAMRLRTARALTMDADTQACASLQNDGAWMLVARSRLRRSLTGRMVFVWQIVCEDACGCPIESQLVALAAPAVARLPRRPALRGAWLATIQQSLLPHVSARIASWQASARAVTGSFSDARLSRERAIAELACSEAVSGRAFQAGLFDRRAERQQRDDEVSAANVRRDWAQRLATIERRGTLTTRAPRLVLVVLP